MRILIGIELVNCNHLGIMADVIKKGEFVYGYEIVGPIGSGAICHTYKALGPNGKFVTMKFPSVAMVGDASTYETVLARI